MRFCYTSEHLDFLRSEYRKLGYADLALAFNAKFGLQKTERQIRTALKNHKITCGRKGGQIKQGKLVAYTQEQFEWLKEQYRLQTLAQLTESFNQKFGTDKTEQQIRSCLRNHRIRSGRTGHFEPMTPPWNTGTKGVMKPNSGSFKKGSVAPNCRPIGAERITKDGYVEIKVAEPNPYTNAPTRFRLKHQVVWEQEHGPVPDGMVVSFVDGDKMNCSLDNLELLHRGDLAVFNKLGGNTLPGEIRTAAKLIAKVSTKSRQRKEQNA